MHFTLRIKISSRKSGRVVIFISLIPSFMKHLIKTKERSLRWLRGHPKIRTVRGGRGSTILLHIVTYIFREKGGCFMKLGGGKSKTRYVTQGGQKWNATIRYIGGDWGQKWPKSALRNFWTAPKYRRTTVSL